MAVRFKYSVSNPQNHGTTNTVCPRPIAVALLLIWMGLSVLAFVLVNLSPKSASGAHIPAVVLSISEQLQYFFSALPSLPSDSQ